MTHDFIDTFLGKLMDLFFQIFSLVVAGIILLWIGYSLLIGKLSPFYPGWFPWGKWKKKAESYKGTPGDPQVCPVCSTKMFRGRLVKTVAFPSVTGGADRLMYIRGCKSCLEHDLPRKCPICGISLYPEDHLVARMYERPRQLNHVHVLGCNHCRKTGKN